MLLGLAEARLLHRGPAPVLPRGQAGTHGQRATNQNRYFELVQAWFAREFFAAGTCAGFRERLEGIAREFRTMMLMVIRVYS